MQVYHIKYACDTAAVQLFGGGVDERGAVTHVYRAQSANNILKQIQFYLSLLSKSSTCNVQHYCG